MVLITAAPSIRDPYDQVHPVESAQFIAAKLEDFVKEIGKLSDSEIKGLKKAQANCPELLTDEFQLWFLRAEVFNADVCSCLGSTVCAICLDIAGASDLPTHFLVRVGLLCGD
jgi:hypothetical protein